MTPGAAPVVLFGALVGAATAALFLPARLARASERLVRTNVSGRRVPAVLGDPLLAGALAGALAVGAASIAGWSEAAAGRVPIALTIVMAALGGAGRLDDLRGDEPARGFRGHLSARRLTGGIIKIVAGGVSGLAAGMIIAGTSDFTLVIETGLLVALAANLLNLLDRAPGRAQKVWLLLALPLFAAGSRDWAIAAGGLLGASLVCLPADLSERAMLGDTGANPLGAAVGLGLALSLERPGRVAAIALLLLLNAASERISFSSIIENAPFLRAVDRMGRK
ncbi:MAG TPA: hypothetical protein VM784_12085 [Actinomycetota bacterium]|nr:hypothetical protein [Actinomycetota bacterium]